MPVKKSELYSSLPRGCDQLRGGMDASQPVVGFRCADTSAVTSLIKGKVVSALLNAARSVTDRKRLSEALAASRCLGT